MQTKRGTFITFEGGEGAGKGTQLDLFRPHLDSLGISHVDIREPGGTRIGELVRDILLDPANANLSARAELLFYGAARAQIVDEIIKPALESGKNVLGDRFYDSTTAYQGFGRGLNLGFIAAMKRFATANLSPDLTIYLDIDPVVALERATTGGADRIEQEGIEFHQEVRKGFLWIATKEPERFRIVDATGTPDEVQERVRALAMPMLDS